MLDCIMHCARTWGESLGELTGDFPCGDICAEQRSIKSPKPTKLIQFGWRSALKVVLILVADVRVVRYPGGPAASGRRASCADGGGLPALRRGGGWGRSAEFPAEPRHCSSRRGGTQVAGVAAPEAQPPGAAQPNQPHRGQTTRLLPARQGTGTQTICIPPLSDLRTFSNFLYCWTWSDTGAITSAQNVDCSSNLTREICSLMLILWPNCLEMRLFICLLHKAYMRYLFTLKATEKRRLLCLFATWSDSIKNTGVVTESMTSNSVCTVRKVTKILRSCVHSVNVIDNKRSGFSIQLLPIWAEFLWGEYQRFLCEASRNSAICARNLLDRTTDLSNSTKRFSSVKWVVILYVFFVSSDTEAHRLFYSLVLAIPLRKRWTFFQLNSLRLQK